MIPKIVHYIWVGSDELPPEKHALVDANRRFLNGFEVKIWLERELDLSSAFVLRAYAAKRWAFVSDYLRFVILRDIGGIYLDADMELLRPLDDLLQVPGFAGSNRVGDSIYCGAIGSVPKHPLMAQLVKDYDALTPGVWPTSPEMLTAAVDARSRDDFVVHPFYTFYPVDEGKKPDPSLLAQAHATHHWDESWRQFVFLRRILRRTGIIPLYHRLRRNAP